MVALSPLGIFATLASFQGAFGGRSPPAVESNGAYNVIGVGTFANKMNITFNNGFPSSQLVPSTDTINDRASNPSAKFNHQFRANLATVSNGFLNLKVPGGQTPGKGNPAQCAEVSTTEDDIMYASVRTYAIFSTVPGTVHGMFFYYNDSQEIDIEYLTDPNSESNPGDGSKPLMYTNQPDATAESPSPSDATSVVHEYRADWLPGRTVFYVDGVKKRTLRSDVPTIPGAWTWNNWCNGDPGFTVGPPKQDNILKIQSMLLYYNTSSS